MKPIQKNVQNTCKNPSDPTDTGSVLLTKMYSVQSHTSSHHLWALFHPPLMCLILLSSDSQLIVHRMHYVFLDVHLVRREHSSLSQTLYFKYKKKIKTVIYSLFSKFRLPVKIQTEQMNWISIVRMVNARIEGLAFVI